MPTGTSLPHAVARITATIEQAAHRVFIGLALRGVNDFGALD
jgi:hypothetical protein